MTEYGDIPMSRNHFEDPTIVPGTRLALLAQIFTPIVWDGKIGWFRVPELYQ